MFPLSQNKVTFIFLVLLGLGLVVGLYHEVTASKPKLTLSEGALIPPRALPDFELIDDEARPFTKEQLRNKWTLLFFGYTHCPSICPRTLQLMKEIKEFLEDAPIQYILISADPKHDSPVQLRNYLRTIDPSFIGLTGTPQEIYTLAEALGIYVHSKEDPKQALHHLPHSGALLFLDPNAELIALFGTPNHARFIANDLYTLIYDVQKGS